MHNFCKTILAGAKLFRISYQLFGTAFSSSIMVFELLPKLHCSDQRHLDAYYQST